jgi:serine/threonine-protein kinase
VYLARQLSLGRLVALKMLPADLAGDEVALARFRREVRALARCEHPHIVKVLASGALPDGRQYYAMEYVPGCDLERLWRELSGTTARSDSSTWAEAVRSASRKQREQTVSPSGDATKAEGAAPPLLPPLPEPPPITDDPGGYARRVAQLGRDAALALQAVHDQGLVHRDVKPGNLMLTADGSRVVLMDFGLAKGAVVTQEVSKGGGLVGTLRYAAPEQLAAATLPVGPAADVRGLGVALWELLTRRRLFAEAEDEKQLAQKVHDEDVPRLRAVDPGLDRDLEAVVARATERRVADRIPSAGQLAGYLQLYLEGKPLPIRPPGVRELAWRWVRSHAALVGLLAGALGVLVLGLVLALMVIGQRREVERGVSADLEEWDRLRSQERWAEGRAVLKRAEERLSGSGAEHLRGRVEQAQRDLDMAVRLEDIGIQKLTPNRKGQSRSPDLVGAEEAYRRAFPDYGLDVQGLEADEAARQVGGSAIREQLIAALDDWEWLQSRLKVSGRERLLAVVQQADDNELRRRVRDAREQEDRAKLNSLARLARTEDLPGTTVLLLGMALDKVGSVEEAVRVLKQGQERHPDNLWLNLRLGLLLDNGFGRRGEAIGFYRAALGVRPDNPFLHQFLGLALKQGGFPEDAVAAYRESLRLNKYSPEVHNNLGNALRDQGDLEGAIAAFRESLRLDKDSPEAHYNLGLALYDKRDLGGAVAAYRQALRLLDKAPPWDHYNLRPLAHCGLGNALRDQGDLGGAIAAYRESLRLNKYEPLTHNNLGVALERKGDLDGAIAAYREAVRLNKYEPLTHNNLGNALYAKRDLGGAVAAYREAIRLKPDYPEAHNNLGNALLDQGDLDGAAAAYREAVRLNKDLPDPHCGLGSALLAQGRFREALEALRTGHALGSKKANWNHPSARWVADAERLVELDGKLPAFLQGRAKPAGAAEALEVARMCAFKRYHAAGARFYAAAFALQPDLAEDLGTGHRYNAACSAALASCGQGERAGTLDEKERTGLRQQALAWLRADFDLCRKGLGSKDAKAVREAREALQHCQRDPDLAGVRDTEALARLPKAERQEWQKLWDEVARLLDQPPAGAAKP